jgi:small-conductance mechanosensitive channel
MVDTGVHRFRDSAQHMIDAAVARLPLLAVAIVVFLIFYFLSILLSQIVRRSTKEHRQNVGIVIARLVGAGTLLLGFLVSFSIVAPSFQASDLIKILGIGGVAIGFAFQNILQNFLAGLLLLWSEPFRVGDEIKLDPFEGTVEEIQTRATIVKTYDERRVVIPNADLFTKSVVVNTALDQRRWDYDITIQNVEDLEGLRGRLLREVESVPGVIDKSLSRKPPDDVLELATEELHRLKGRSASPLRNVRLGEFFTTVFLPHAKDNLRPSTYNEYAKLWKRYFKQRSFAAMWLRDVKTHHVQKLLEDIVRTHHIGKRTISHVKHLLSGIFRFAAQQDYLDASRNPVTLASIPGFASKPTETCAYSLEDVLAMLRVLSDPAQTVVAVAAFAGLRAGEIRGLTWDVYHPSTNAALLATLRVERSVWQTFTTDPKTEKSRAAIPVVPQLAERLDAWRRANGNPVNGPIFANGQGKPLSLDSLHWRYMRDVLKRSNIQWHGWHAFRRGLATNLNRLGVDDSVIQAILRHSHIGVTQSCYIKTVRQDVEVAMQQFSEAVTKSCSLVVLQKPTSGAPVSVQ